MQVLNLRREFELLRMKESKSVKDYSERLMKTVNQIRLLGEDLPERRVVEKVLVSLLERFESKISSLEDSRDLSQLSLAKLVNALQAVEQRKAYRLEETSEHALLTTHKGKVQSEGGRKSGGEKRNDEKRDQNGSKGKGKKGKFPPCPHCKKRSHTENYCWFRPSVKCRACNQLGHLEKVCKNKINQ